MMNNNNNNRPTNNSNSNLSYSRTMNQQDQLYLSSQIPFNGGGGDQPLIKPTATSYAQPPLPPQQQLQMNLFEGSPSFLTTGFRTSQAPPPMQTVDYMQLLEEKQRQIEQLQLQNSQLQQQVTQLKQFTDTLLGRSEADVGILVTSGVTGEIIAANSIIQNILGYNEQSWWQNVRRWSHIVAQDDRQRVFASFLASAGLKQDNCFIDFMGITATGAMIPLQTNHVPSQDKLTSRPAFTVSFIQRAKVPPPSNMESYMQ